MLYDVWKMEGAECEMESRSILGFFFPLRHAAGGKSKEKDGEMNGAFVFLQIKCFSSQALSRLSFILTEGINRWKKHRMFNLDIHK